MFHNDYVNTVREYLYRYHEFTQYIKNVEADIKDCQAELDLEPTLSSPSLSPTGGCGGGEKTSEQERWYIRREELQGKIEEYSHELQRLGPMMARLNRSLDAIGDISETDKMILVDRFIDKASWDFVARHTNSSVGYCRKRSCAALETLARMMFGPDADGPVAFFREP